MLIDAIQLSNKLCETPIACELAYATKENFIGRVIDGYHPEHKNICLMTPKAAGALCEVQNHLLHQHQIGLLIFDAYRPLHAVKDFANWFEQPITDDYELQRKAIHYPHHEKNQLADLGYIAKNISQHCFYRVVYILNSTCGTCTHVYPMMS
jgi:D-alanyl-D-alanine dipeptidase